MANLSSDNLAAKQDEFASEQLKPVDALYAANPDQVDFDAAKTIGLISVDVRKRIQAKMGKDEGKSLFKRALGAKNIDRMDESGRRMAFKHAFEAVYGRFLFEDADVLAEEDRTHLETKLGGVLKFPIDLKYKLTGRSELQAAVKRVRMFGGSKDSVDAILSQLLQQKTNTESEIASLKKANAPIVYKLGKLDELDEEEEFDRILGRLERIEEMGEISKEGSNTLKSEKNPELKKQLDQRQITVVECFEKIHSAHAALGEINQILTQYYPDAFNYDKLGISKLLANLDEFLNTDNDNVDIDRLEELFHKHLKPLSEKLSSGIFFRTLISKVHGNPALADKMRNFLSDVKYLNGAIHKIREYEILLHDLEITDQDISDFEAYKTDNAKSVNKQKILFFQQLTAAGSAVRKFAKKLPKDAEAECARYLEASEKFGTEKDPQTRTLSELKEFVQNVYKPFLDLLRRLLQDAKGANDGQFNDKNNALLDLNTRIARFENYQASNTADSGNKLEEAEEELKAAIDEKRPANDIEKLRKRVDQLKGYLSPVRWILDQAFGGGKTGAEMKTLERQHNEAKKAQSDLIATSEYFSGAELASVTEVYTQFSSLLTKSEFEDNKESFQAKKFRLEAEYNALSSSRVNQGAKKGIDQQVESKFRSQNPNFNADKSKRAKALEDEMWTQYMEKNPGGTPEDEKRVKAEARTTAEAEYRDKAAELNAVIRTDILKDDNKQSINLAIEQGKEAGKKKREFQLFQDVETQAKSLADKLKVLLEKMENASKSGVEFKTSNGEVIDVKAYKAKFESVSIASDDFSPQGFSKDFEPLISFFKDSANVAVLLSNFDAKLADKDKAVKTSKSALEKAKSGNAMNENLTDAQAAKKIIATLVAQQFPDMSLEDQYKMATAILAEDVATIQTTESYEKFAERAGADVLDTMKQAGFKGKLIGFKYKIGDKEEQPFKGLKPEDFADWPTMERHFNTGKFNHENGFFILAAMELFNGDVKSIQAVKTEKMLKTLIAKQLGVDERMDEAGISRIVDKAFDKQREKVRPLVKSYFDHYDSNREEWESHSLRAMKLKLKALNQDRRTGKITEEVYAMKYEVLLKEAEASGVLDKLGLAKNTVLASFANSPFSQWFRDRGYDFKERAKKKAAGFVWSTTKVAASGLWGATKFTAKLATKPITIPLKLAAKLGVGFVNLFRANKWQPEILQKKTASETKSLLERTKEVASGVVSTYAEDWKARTHDKTKFSDRIEMGSDVLSSQADELAEKGKSTAVDTTSPFIDLEEFKKQIAMIDAMKNAPASNDNKESKAA